jgi:hypothetical protein
MLIIFVINVIVMTHVILSDDWTKNAVLLGLDGFVTSIMFGFAALARGKLHQAIEYVRRMRQPFSNTRLPRNDS